ncbi:MAG TPA: hypothetical protein VF062_16350 [Candidatus Limnocylindrales bacterium]
MTSFYVLPNRLTAAAGPLGGVADGLWSAANDAGRVPVPVTAFARIPEAVALHRALETAASRSSGRLDELGHAVQDAGSCLTDIGRGYAAADVSVAQSYRKAFARPH